MQASLAKGVDATDKLHLVSADISALPADLADGAERGLPGEPYERTALLAALAAAGADR